MEKGGIKLQEGSERLKGVSVSSSFMGDLRYIYRESLPLKMVYGHFFFPLTDSSFFIEAARVTFASV